MLPDFIEANCVSAELVKCPHPVETAKDAAEAMKVSLNSIAKTILLVDNDDNGVLAVVLGTDSVNLAKLEKAAKLTGLRLASRSQTENMTGYEAGALPPISVYGVKTVVDEKVMQKKFVVCGGGTTVHLMKIAPQELKKCVEDLVTADISL